MEAKIKRPLSGELPYFSDDDLNKLANWINENISGGQLELKSLLEGDEEVLVAIINK